MTRPVTEAVWRPLGQHDDVKVAVAFGLFLLPVAPAVVLYEATTEQGDANIGGGLVMAAALGVGLYFGVSRLRDNFSARTLAVGLAILLAVFAFTFGGEALEEDAAAALV